MAKAEERNPNAMEASPAQKQKATEPADMHKPETKEVMGQTPQRNS